MHMDMPPGVRRVIELLEENGAEAFAVGGCVRDTLLGRAAHDWDITTSAKPEKIKRIFRHTVDTGIAHGTVTVLHNQEAYEVTTYRIDGEYLDGRHPKDVQFTSDLREDLRRRDFTVNAMAYNDRTGLIDLFGGQEDLKNGIIRCVGEAQERFGEDALRILRAFRFAAQLNFSIDPETEAAAGHLADMLGRISAERIREELVRLLVSDHPEMIRRMADAGITKYVLPEWDCIRGLDQTGPHHDLDVSEHTILVMLGTEPAPVLRLAALMHDFGKAAGSVTDEQGNRKFPGHAGKSAQIAGKVLRRLKFDNDTRNRVVHLIEWHSFFPEADEKSVRKAAYEIGPGQFDEYLKLKRADLLGQKASSREERLDRLQSVQRTWEKICLRGDCLSLKDLHITGSDLIADGMEKGRRIGIVLKWLLEDVLDEPEHNEYGYLLEQSRKLRNTLEEE